jgi:hypothetical protein
MGWWTIAAPRGTVCSAAGAKHIVCRMPLDGALRQPAAYSAPMQTYSASQTHARLPPAALIESLQAMLREGCTVPPRQVHAIADAAGPKGGHAAGQLLLMAAWQPGRLIGVKTATVFPTNGQRGLPLLHATYMLFDATTGAVVAQIDGAALTARRTACVAALAASRLARSDATRLLVVGAGAVASLLPAAMSVVRPIAVPGPSSWCSGCAARACRPQWPMSCPQPCGVRTSCAVPHRPASR